MPLWPEVVRTSLRRPTALKVKAPVLNAPRPLGSWTRKPGPFPDTTRLKDPDFPYRAFTQFQMYGDLGNKLVQHAKRTQKLEHLPPYQTEIVRSVTREVRDLDKDVSHILSSYNGSFEPSADPATACTLLVDHLCMRRNKRCLLAYHRTRTDKLEELVWSGSDIADLTGQGQQQRGEGQGGAEGNRNSSSLSPEEEEYVSLYSDLLAAFKGQWTDIDLSGSLEPPKDLFIDVRVLKDAGEIQTEYGTINLTRNSQFYVRQGDVERLIAQGYLQKLS